MFDKDNRELMRQIIMDHYTNPDFKGLIENKKAKIMLQDSPTCSDEINVQLLIENNVIKQARFEGYACSIATASTNIICSQLINTPISKALEILNNYHNMIVGLSYNEEQLDELIVFCNIYKQGNRINCALLGAEGFRKILIEEE